MSRTIAPLLAIALCFSTPVGATTAMGIGTRDCTAFLRASEISSKEALDAYVAWGLGYLTGHNAYASRGREVVVDGGSLVYWLGDWCASHREAVIFDALEEFVRQNGG
jgi:hypothetical protein